MRIQAGAVVCAWVCVVASGLAAQELTLSETPQGQVFGNERLAVRLDPQTGWACEVLCDGRAVVEAAATRQFFDLKQDEGWVTGGGAQIEGLGVTRVASDTVCSRMRVGEWSLDAYVQLFPEPRRVRRWFEITWNGQRDAKLKAFWFQGGELPLGPGGSYFAPAQYPPRRTVTAALVPGRRVGSGRSPYPIIAETGGGWSAVWTHDELVPYADRGSASAQEEAGRIRVTQAFHAQGHMRKGEPQKVGDAWLWLQPNDAETALVRMGEWFRQVGQVPPADRPAWLKRVILYSFHPGGTIGSQCQDLGGFQAATALLPHIRGLGCNALWLMPLEDKSIYWPRDYYKLQEGLGSPEDYKALTAQARALGMRVWQDCVPHGGCNEYPRAKEHPEWLAQNEDGSTLHYWCFDFNWPTWIDYMSGVVSFYTREYGLDGFRIDACGGSKIPNWNPAIPYARASHAQAQGGLAMQRALRAAVKTLRPDGANLAEVGSSIHGAVSDSTYDFDLCYHVLHDFRKLPAEEFVPRLRRWLHEQQCAEIPDLVRMRHVESHDSLRSGLWYGADAQRALVALTSWIHGIPMVYHEMENGHYDAYRQIFHVRSEVPELNDGAADYLSVTAPDGVFACLRTNSASASVVLVNLSGQPVSGAVSVPAVALRGAAWARDLMTGAKVAVRDGRLEVALAPFGYTVLRAAGAALPVLPALKPAAPAKPAAKLDASARVKSRTGSLLIDGGTGLAWKFGWSTVPLRLDLALPAHLADTNQMTTIMMSQPDSRFFRLSSFSEGGLALAYESAEEGVEVRAEWLGNRPVARGQRAGETVVSNGVRGRAPEGAALLLDLPSAERWFAVSAEGTFESPFRVRHPGCDGVVGSIYRLPQGGASLWDSRLHPFGLDAAHARVGAEVGGRRVSFAFDPARLPASVQLLDRVGDDRGLKVLITWRDSAYGVTSGVDEARFTIRTEAGGAAPAAGTGDARLTAVGGGWQFENAHYRARVGRSGALAGLWRREGEAWKPVVRRSKLYTDRGFEGDKALSQEDDVEATARIERCAEGVRLSFCGELRGFYRFDKMAHPIRFYSAYLFGDGPAFRRTCAFNAETVTAAKYAFLSLLTNVEGAERVAFSDAGGEFLAGLRGDGKARAAQTAKAADPARLPCEVRVSDAAGLALRLSGLTWFGQRPANIFLHGADLHLAWMDGAPDNSGAGRWNGVSLSVSCAEGAEAPADELPLALGGGAALLRDGGFEAAEGLGGLRLAGSGRELPQPERDRRTAWQLPAGAGYEGGEGGGRCVRVEGDGREYRLVRQALPAQAFPEGSRWRLTARVRAAGVRAGDQGWKTACVRWGLRAGERFTYATASLPQGDTGWRELSVEMTAPAGLTAVTVEAGMNGNAGRIWVDDLRVERLDGL